MRYLMVTGSRNWTNRFVINEYIHDLANRGWLGSECHLINGYADGADQQLRTAAILLGWTPIDYKPKNYQEGWMSYGRACNRRNEAMADRLAQERLNGHETLCVAFWKNRSVGTGNTLGMLRERGFKPTVFHDCGGYGCCNPEKSWNSA